MKAAISRQLSVIHFRNELAKDNFERPEIQNASHKI